MRSLHFRPLHVALHIVCACCVACQENVGRSAASGTLKRSMGAFQLTGGAEATLRQVNGGRLCVNGFGKMPPGYYFRGPIGLDLCAQIASEQTSPLGFQWGRTGFDYGAYTSYATPAFQGGNGTTSVDLGLLFPTAGDFLCTVFVGVDARGQPFKFKKSNSSTGLKPKVKDGPARSVCFQRWTMAEFFKPYVMEMWFCYMPTTASKECATKADAFYFQGKIFVLVFMFFLGVLGWIMADIPEFETPLVWFTRFLLNMELGMVGVAFLLETMSDTEGPLFFMTAYLIDVVGSQLLFLPYYVMEHFSPDSPFNTAYLLLLAFSPCFLMEFMSYWSHFILLVGHQPLLIGFIAFSTTACGVRYFRILEASWEEDDANIKRRPSTDSMDRASYVSVALDEPEAVQPCCKGNRSWKDKLSLSRLSC